MNWKLIILSGFLAIFLIPQDVESAGNSKLMKIGKKISKKFGSYTKPLLAGTERTAGKVTRDLGVASKFTARNVINGIIVANKRSTSLLRFIKKRFFKKKGAKNSSPPPAEAPAASSAPAEEAPEEPAAEAPVEHVDAAEETPVEETHAEEEHAEPTEETHVETATSGEHDAP